jgi:hypothetical protein
MRALVSGYGPIRRDEEDLWNIVVESKSSSQVLGGRFLTTTNSYEVHNFVAICRVEDMGENTEGQSEISYLMCTS